MDVPGGKTHASVLDMICTIAYQCGIFKIDGWTFNNGEISQVFLLGVCIIVVDGLRFIYTVKCIIQI